MKSKKNGASDLKHANYENWHVVIPDQFFSYDVRLRSKVAIMQLKIFGIIHIHNRNKFSNQNIGTLVNLYIHPGRPLRWETLFIWRILSGNIIGNTFLGTSKPKAWQLANCFSTNGGIIRALIIGVINNSINLLNIFPFFQQTVKGLGILVAVILDRVTTKT